MNRAVSRTCQIPEKMKIKFIILLSFLSVMVWGQEARELSLQNAIDSALQNNYGIIIQQINTDIAEEQNQVATQTWDTASRYILGNGQLNDFLTTLPVSLFDSASLADIKAWHAETFRTGDIKIAAAGPVEPTVIAGAIDQLLDGLPTGAENDGSASMDKSSSKSPRYNAAACSKPSIDGLWDSLSNSCVSVGNARASRLMLPC